MINLAANLTMLFTEVPLLDRYAAAAAAGFRGVELQFPYVETPEAVARARAEAGVTQVLINMPPGDWAAGERGLAALPGREEEFRASVGQALEYAEALDCQRLHAMAGVLPENADIGRVFDTYVQNLRFAAEACAAVGREVTIEPINDRIDMPGYALNSLPAAATVQDKVRHPALRLQIDVYHMAVMGELEKGYVRRFLSRVGHVQIADYPGRHEPGSGELPFDLFFSWLSAENYEGWVGCEYHPAAGTVEGLGWAARYLSEAEG